MAGGTERPSYSNRRNGRILSFQRGDDEPARPFQVLAKGHPLFSSYLLFGKTLENLPVGFHGFLCPGSKWRAERHKGIRAPINGLSISSNRGESA